MLIKEYSSIHIQFDVAMVFDFVLGKIPDPSEFSADAVHSQSLL